MLLSALAGHSAARVIWVDPTHASATDGGIGLKAQPLKTIKRAAAIARAGDVVTVLPGEYREKDIEIVFSGTRAQPIVFQAAFPGTVRVIGGPQVESYTRDESPILFGDRDRQAANHELWSGAEYITVRGMMFENAQGVAIAAGTGWRIEDCRVRWAMYDGIVARGDDITIARTVVEDSGNNGMTGGFGKNISIVDSIVRRSNRIGNAPGDTTGASKFLWTTGLRVAGLVSYDNFGSGWWMDWNNVDYSVTGCTIFGNHAGEAMQKGWLVNQYWAGSGIWTEGNPGPGRIADNLIYSNVGSGIGVLESMDVVVENNDIFDCGRGIELRDVLREDGANDANRIRRVMNVTIRGNRIKAWRDDAAIATSVGEWSRGRDPSGYKVSFNGNVFDPVGDRSLLLWLNHTPLRQSPALNLLGESNKIEKLPTLEPAIKTYSTELRERDDPVDVRFRQVDSKEAEQRSILDALSGRAIGDTIVIPVAGRRAVTVREYGGWTCDVYDLAAATHARLMLPDEASVSLLKSILMPHATLKPVSLNVRLRSIDPYNIEAELLGPVPHSR